MHHHNDLIADLKENGQQITVDLTTCDIRGNDYMETREASDDATQSALFLAPSNMRSFINKETNVEVQQSVFICELNNPVTGQQERFLSPVIPKDKITLSFYLDNQKTTTLYIDKSDPTRYYFDLDFLIG